MFYFFHILHLSFPPQCNQSANGFNVYFQKFSLHYCFDLSKHKRKIIQHGKVKKKILCRPLNLREFHHSIFKIKVNSSWSDFFLKYWYFTIKTLLIFTIRKQSEPEQRPSLNIRRKYILSPRWGSQINSYQKESWVLVITFYWVHELGPAPSPLDLFPKVL